jgi:hypothetical protein
MYQGHKNTKDGGLVQGVIQSTVITQCVCYYDIWVICLEIYNKNGCTFKCMLINNLL